MHPQLESVFDEAEKRYLKPEELTVLNQYVGSLPNRLELYRQLRDREIDVMQTVADNLSASMPNASQANLERSIKNALLVLRYCAMGMLLEDQSFVQDKVSGWLKDSMQAYNTTEIDTQLYQLLDQQLAQVFDAQQMGLLRPMLELAQSKLFGNEKPVTADALGW